MRFVARRATLADLFAGKSRWLDAYGVDRDLHDALPDFWKAGIAAGGLFGHIVHSAESPSFYAACALSMMAKPEFLAEVLAREAGGFGEHAVRWFTEGRTPWLTAEETRRASAGGGVDVVGLHNDLGLGAEVEENPDELVELHNAFWFQIHRGLGVASLHRSAFTLGGLKWALNSGQRLRPRAGFPTLDGVPTPERPAITGVRRDELPEIRGTRMARFFTHVPPRLRLGESHRELLTCALAGDTDEEIAEALSLSLSAVKKRWAALYDHVQEVAPDWLEESSRLLDGSGRRGVERRRRFLNLLRDHPEEMNPQAG